MRKLSMGLSKHHSLMGKDSLGHGGSRRRPASMAPVGSRYLWLWDYLCPRVSFRLNIIDRILIHSLTR